MTKSLSVEFAPYVNVNAVSPGWVNTDMNKDLPKDLIDAENAKTPLRRFAEPSEIAKPIVFLCSGDASYITGTMLEIHGGYQ